MAQSLAPPPGMVMVTRCPAVGVIDSLCKCRILWYLQEIQLSVDRKRWIGSSLAQPNVGT